MKKYLVYFVLAFVCMLIVYDSIPDREYIANVSFKKDGIDSVEIVRIDDVVEVRVTTFAELTCDDVYKRLEITEKNIAGATWQPECFIRGPDHIVIRYEKWNYVQ